MRHVAPTKVPAGWTRKTHPISQEQIKALDAWIASACAPLNEFVPDITQFKVVPRKLSRWAHLKAFLGL